MENTSLLKKRTYGSLSLGGSYGTSKRGDMSLLRLGSGFGRTSRGNIRSEDIEVVPQAFDNYLRNKLNYPHIFIEPASLEDITETDNFVSGLNNGRKKEYAPKTSPVEEFNQAD